MKLFNYKAFSIHDVLSSKILLPAENLEEFINDLQANKTMYHGYYELEHRDMLAKYEGVLKPTFDTIHIDLDSKEDGGALAWEQTKELCKRLQESGCSFQLYFSGNKGFHVAVHTSAFGLSGTKPAKDYQDIIRNIAHNLKEQYSTVDPSVHDPVRKFRAYRSKHEKSGLYKIRLTKIGLSRKPSELSIEEIRELALMQPTHKYAHPEPVLAPIDWLQALISSTPQQAQASRKSKVKEIEQGSTIEDDSLRFKNFSDKKCTKLMLEGTVLPQFNRHDIELALIVELRQVGKTVDEAAGIMDQWAQKVYKSEPDRAKDVSRQVRDIYGKALEADKLYQYGCYGEIKAAYCSAKCKIYNNLDKKRRPEPLDATKTQKTENDVRRNPSMELSEGQLADKIMKEMPMLCKSNGQYFQWITTHWKRIDGDMFEDGLVKVAMNMYGNQATIKKNKALAEHVIAKIPIAPESNHFFSSCPNKFNFTDCTAVMIQDGKELRLEKKTHSPEDYLAYCAPFPLEADHTMPKGSEFSKYMATRLQDVGEEGIRIIKQMLGAALIPYVPRIFFIEGVTNAGKSTLAKLIIRLLGQENVSEVLPLIKGGGADRFNWEPSIGKLANIVLELPKGAELDVNTLKMVRDKSPISIDRKQQKHVKATLPFIHIYCCNQMPQSYEGNSGALNNRVSMLFFKPGYLNGSGDIVEYADHIWNDDAAGVLEVAREGLADLIASGFRYFNGNESAKMTREWQKMTDNITLYFEEINSGEWSGPSFEGVEWEKGSIMYSDFRQWCIESGRKPMGKQLFYKELETRFQVPRKNNAKGGERFLVEKVIQKPINRKPDANPTAVTSLDY